MPSACVCVQYENVNSIMAAIGLELLTKNCDIILKYYHDCFKLSTWKTCPEVCFSKECESCPKLDALKKYLRFVMNCIKEVTILS